MRMSSGSSYDAATATVVGNFPSGTTSFATTDGLESPGDEASFKLFVVLTTGNEAGSNTVLMLAHMNAEALDRTIATGEVHYWSRSRNRLWKKGETSGNVMKVVEVRIDCDQDAVWLRCEPAGPACHTGEASCFYRRIEDDCKRLQRVMAPKG